MEGGVPVAFDRILRLEALDPDYRTAYDAEPVDAVGRIHADDIRLLGYRFE